jgi:hypothetical protein
MMRISTRARRPFVALLAALSLASAALDAHAQVTPAEIRSYLKRPSAGGDWTWSPSTQHVQALLHARLKRGGLAGASEVLARDWKITTAAASAIAEAILLRDVDVDFASRGEEERLESRIRKATEAAVALAPDSVDVWAAAQAQWDWSGECGRAGRADAFFERPWSREAFLTGRANDCGQWILQWPRHAPMESRVYAYLGEWADADADRIAAACLRRELLGAEGVEGADARMIDAQRAYLSALAKAGLWRAFVAELDGFEAATREAVLVAEPGADSDTLRFEWLYALALAERRDEARLWIARIHEGEPADDAALARLVADGDPRDDPFDTLIGDGEQGLLWSAGQDAIAGLAAVHYLERAGYRFRLDDLVPAACREDSPALTTADVATLPARFREVREQVLGQLRDARRDLLTCPASLGANAAGALAAARAPLAEKPLPAELRSARDGNETDADHPSTPVPGLDDIHVVRVDRQGERIAALSLSQSVDPVGEVSGGGYWLHLSNDGGRAWEPATYLGLQEYVPYVVRPDSKLPLLEGRRLRVEVAVRELDPESVTFPPVGLATLREADDLYVELPLDELERDSDGDGLTDLLEDKLRTDPHSPDTDGDGMPDDVDTMPQASATAPPSEAAEILSAMLPRLLGYDRNALQTGGPGSADPVLRSTLETLLASVSGRASEPARTVFVRGDPAQFAGVVCPVRVFIVTDADERHVRDHYGLFYPLSLPVWINRDRTRAVVRWSAGWVGGTVEFTKRDGQWTSREVGGWIT